MSCPEGRDSSCLSMDNLETKKYVIQLLKGPVQPLILVVIFTMSNTSYPNLCKTLTFEEIFIKIE